MQTATSPPSGRALREVTTKSSRSGCSSTRRPTNTGSIPPVTVSVGTTAAAINVSSYFADVDILYRDSLTYSISSNDQAASITPTWNGSQLTLTIANGFSGTAHLSVRATDTTGSTIDAPLTVNVLNGSLTLNAIPNQSVNPGGTMAFTASAVDTLNPGATLTYSLDSGAPSGAAINSSTGVFSWTPTNVLPGAYQATVRVTDNGVSPATTSQVVNITLVNQAPVWTTIASQTVALGQMLNLTASASTPAGAPETVSYSLAATNLDGSTPPTGAAINATTGAFSWTASGSTGSYEFTLVATNNGSPVLSSSQMFGVTVTHVNSGTPVLVHTALAGSADRDTTQANLGVLVSSLTGGISDGDPGALKGIAIVGIDTAHGALQYSANGGSTWTSVVSPSTSNALLLPADANTRVRLVPSDTYLGTITDAITFRAWDQTSGTADSYANTTTNGGTTAFSTATDTVSMTIDPAVGAQIQANSDSTGTHTPVGTALDSQGNSVVAWTVVSGSNTNLMARSYSPNGSPLGAEFQVNTAGTSVSSAAVAMNASGTSIFVWSVYANSTYTVYSQRFNNSTGTAIDSAPVSLFTNTSVSYLSVGIAANNGFVVSFGTSGTTTFTVQHEVPVGPMTLFACVFDANNVLQSGSPITVTSVSGSILNASLSVAGDGSFVVDWTS